MGASLWDQVGLPLLIGLAIQIVVVALCFLSVRIWNCLMRQIATHTAAAGESVHTQSLPESDAAAEADGVPDLEMGNGYGPAEGGESMAEPESEPGIVNGGEVLNIQVTENAARAALVPSVPVPMYAPHSQQEEAAAE